MSTVWKVLVGLALVVPMGAYVAGSLAASASDDPSPRHSITIREPSPSSTRSSSPTPTHSDEPGEVEVITPSYDDLDDHGGDDHGGHGGHGGDDGGGGDDRSGHGRGGGED